MDAKSSKQGAPGRVLNGTLSEKVPSGLSSPIVPASSNHLSIDTQAAALRNGAYDSPATASRIPDGQIEELVRSQHFTLRTLPRMLRNLDCLIILDSKRFSSLSLTFGSRSMDSVCPSRR